MISAGRVRQTEKRGNDHVCVDGKIAVNVKSPSPPVLANCSHGSKTLLLQGNIQELKMLPLLECST